MTLDITKPCQTRDGRNAEYVGPVPGVPGIYVWKISTPPAVTIQRWVLEKRFENGRDLSTALAPGDIINVPEPAALTVALDHLRDAEKITELRGKITLLERDNKLLEASRDQWQAKGTEWMHRYFAAKQFIRNGELASGRFLEGQP